MTITLTPIERWQLAMLFLHKDLTVKGRKSERQIVRARQELGCVPILEAVRDFKGSVSTAQAFDKTPSLFTLESITLDQLKEFSDLPKAVECAVVLDAVITRCEAADGKPSPVGEPWDESKENWAPPLPPESSTP